jgi:DNA polymerase-3 subunit gamma/tau
LDRLISTGAECLTAGLFEQYLGCADSEKIYELVSRIGASDGAGTLTAIEDLISGGSGEVQIVDSLIDCMRDLMVVKSAGAESELLVLTGRQKKQVCELAESFDIAALVYNITALEKLRWTIKNSETARALLEAALLRFALSEHFINVDAIIQQPQDGAVKKKHPIERNAVVEPAVQAVDTAPDEKNGLFGADKLQSIKDNWRRILDKISSRLGPSTTGLLSSAVPSRFEDGVLTVSFARSAGIFRKMCESNGRTKTIESLLSEQLGTNLRLRFETDENSDTPNDAASSKDRGRRENEIINDPAVRTVLIELGATITGIEENQK